MSPPRGSAGPFLPLLSRISPSLPETEFLCLSPPAPNFPGAQITVRRCSLGFASIGVQGAQTLCQGSVMPRNPVSAPQGDGTKAVTPI